MSHDFASAPVWWRDGPGDVLRLFRTHPDGLTKSDVMQQLRMSRTAASQRIDLLIDHGFLSGSATRSTRGRPAEQFRFDASAGVVLTADAGATGVTLAVADLAGRVISTLRESLDITEGPEHGLRQIDEGFHRLLDEQGKDHSEVRGVGVDVPGPVDHASGRVISPPIMTGWHGTDVRAHVRRRFDVPVVVEKDTTAMAYGEFRAFHPGIADLVFVKLGTGVGSGLVTGGRIHRGSDGAAGDIGHVQVSVGSSDGPACRCGNLGCVEAYASGWALIRDLAAGGLSVSTVDDVVDLAHAGDLVVREHVRKASTVLGTAISDLVNIVNPRVVVIGGQLSRIDDILFAGIREVVYRRSLPLATRNLQILRTSLDDLSGVHGLAHLVTDAVFDPTRVDQTVGHGRG